MQERTQRILIASIGVVVALACILVARSDGQVRVPISRCSNCGVVQYRWYYVIDLWGWRVTLPNNLDVSGGQSNCPHRIEWIDGPSY